MDVHKCYQRRVFNELQGVIDGVSEKPPLPLHDITPQDLRVFMRELCRVRSTIPITVRGMQQQILLERTFRAEDDQQDIIRSNIDPGVVDTIGEHPAMRSLPVTGDDIVDDWKGQKARVDKVHKVVRSDPPVAFESTEAAGNSSKENGTHGEDTKTSATKGGPMSMVCKYCGKPKAKGYNAHTDDGTRYGLCPEQPPKIDPDPAVVAYSRALAKELIVEFSEERKGTRHCGLCGIALSAVMRDRDGNILLAHERFADEDQKLMCLCPLAGNIPPSRVEELRVLKKQRSDAKAARRREAKRNKYQEKKRPLEGHQE